MLETFSISNKIKIFDKWTQSDIIKMYYVQNWIIVFDEHALQFLEYFKAYLYFDCLT